MHRKAIAVKQALPRTDELDATKLMTDDKLLTPADLSAMLCRQVSVATLKKWRGIPGRGPEFIKVGRATLYPESAVHRWLLRLAAETAAHRIG